MLFHLFIDKLWHASIFEGLNLTILFQIKNYFAFSDIDVVILL
jgi:hypothetical protein